VNNLAGENDFLLEARGAGGVGRYLGSNDFESDAGSLKKLILRLVDLSHAAARNKANHQKAIGDELCGLEASSCDRVICSRRT
jgi:hypothetical protein